MGRAIQMKNLNNSDDIKAWDSANEHLCSILRLTHNQCSPWCIAEIRTKNSRPGDGRQAWLALKNKDQNTSRRRRRILLQRLDNSVMRSDMDPHVFLSRVFQLRDELSDLG